MTKEPTNIAASVHARLLNRARADGRPFNELLQYFAMERFLYRLSRSQHADRFVLKGALMLQFWGGPLTRATKDIDLLGRSTFGVEELVEVVRCCAAIDVEEDGLKFDEASVVGEEIRLAAHYSGVRARLGAGLGNARVTLQVDVGFGDIVTPGAQEIEYPTLLGFTQAHLLGYTPETVVAEKLHAMVTLDIANTRLKDFLDVWTLAQGRDFHGPVLAAGEQVASKAATEVAKATGKKAAEAAAKKAAQEAAKQASLQVAKRVIGAMNILFAAWTLIDLAGPAKRVTIPAVTYIALLRQLRIRTLHFAAA